MSDDTPTQRFPASDDVQEDLQEEKQKSKGLLIGLLIAGALLLVAIIVLVFFLGRATGTPGAGETQTSTPSASATPEPTNSTPTPTTEPEEPEAPPAPQQPQSTAADFSAFSPKKQVSCSFPAPGFTPEPPPIQIGWASIRADSAWIVQGTSDAADSGFMQIPLNGNETNFQYPLAFPCFQANATYTITLVGSDGHHVSRSWTVTNIGDKS